MSEVPITLRGPACCDQCRTRLGAGDDAVFDGVGALGEIYCVACRPGPPSPRRSTFTRYPEPCVHMKPLADLARVYGLETYVDGHEEGPTVLQCPTCGVEVTLDVIVPRD